MWRIITDLGDSHVTLPLFATALIYWGVVRKGRAALAWFLAVGGCGAVMLLLKLILKTCGPALHGAIASPSGHTAMSTAVYGGLCLLFSRSMGRWARFACHGATALLVLSIALSREVLKAHDWAEIVIGLAVGLAALAVYRAILHGGPSLGARKLWGLFLVVGVVGGLAYGRQWPVEAEIDGFALWFRPLVAACQ